MATHASTQDRLVLGERRFVHLIGHDAVHEASTLANRLEVDFTLLLLFQLLRRNTRLQEGHSSVGAFRTTLQTTPHCSNRTMNYGIHAHGHVSENIV